MLLTDVEVTETGAIQQGDSVVIRGVLVEGEPFLAFSPSGDLVRAVNAKTAGRFSVRRIGSAEEKTLREGELRLAPAGGGDVGLGA